MTIVIKLIIAGLTVLCLLGNNADFGSRPEAAHDHCEGTCWQ